MIPTGATLALGLLLGAVADAGYPRVAEVADESLDVYQAPDAGSLPTGRLRKGDRVVVIGEEPGGWLAIRPPEGSFSLIESRAIRMLGGDRARVEAARAAVRPARPGARLPGAVQVFLAAGDVVRLVDRPPLEIGPEDARRTWLAIEPPAGEVRYVPVDGLADRRPIRPVAPALKPEPEGPEPLPRGLPAALRDELDRLEARHRAAVSGPADGWDLRPIRSAYQALLESTQDPEARRILGSRLGRVEQQEDLARVASGFLTRLRLSRSRDEDLDRLRAGIALGGAAAPGRYAAEGLFLPSAERWEGNKLYALIGVTGQLAGLVELPPTLLAAPFLGRRVGILGSVRYPENLPVRLIRARDIDALDEAP